MVLPTSLSVNLQIVRLCEREEGCSSLIFLLEKPEFSLVESGGEGLSLFLSNSERKSSVMSENTHDVMRGTLDLLVMRILSLEPMHGWGISERIQERSGEVFQVTQGSLYPALHRLERRGLVTSYWGTSEKNRRAKYYRLTGAGKRAMAAEEESFDRFIAAVQAVLGRA
jgi:transcriptional regulator